MKRDTKRAASAETKPMIQQTRNEGEPLRSEARNERIEAQNEEIGSSSIPTLFLSKMADITKKTVPIIKNVKRIERAISNIVKPPFCGFGISAKRIHTDFYSSSFSALIKPAFD